MKKIIIFVFVFALLGNSFVFAHPPKSIMLDYDKQTGKLAINIRHNVSKTKMHYINEVVIKAGESGYFIEEFPLQSSKTAEQLTVELPSLKKGDKIEVTAKCSVYGKKTKTLIVE